MNVSLTLLMVVFCLLAEAFFSGAEIGLVSADRIKLRHAAGKGSRGAKLALKMLERPEWLLSTTLVGTNIAVVTNTTLVTALTIDLLGEQYSWLAVAIVAPLIWILGEIVPKSLFQQHADQVTPYAVYLLRIASYIFSPLLVVFSTLARLVARMFGSVGTTNPFTLREEIAIMLTMSSVQGDILPVEKDMIRRVFNFGETTVKDIMIPLVDVVAIEKGATCGEAMELAVKESHKRLPVYEDRVDNIVGILNTLDLLTVPHDESIDGYVRQATCSPLSKGIDDLLLALRRDRGQTTIVVDEYGGAQGVVMLEDILEQVVGELEDEYDHAGVETPSVHRVGERQLVVSGRCTLEELNEATGQSLPKGEFETVAGFLIDISEEIPPLGATIVWRDLSFTITKRTEQSIQETRVQW
jgi:CBS domain containing-hemolysin-like protein